MTRESDIETADGRTLHVYDTGSGPVTVFWHGGTPQTGAPPEPLAQAGVRWLSLDRPGYGGSSPQPGRDIASVAADVAAVADAAGVERFAVMGASGGGPHALACAALLPDRVFATACLATVAPFDAPLDWFEGMGPAGIAEFRATESGRPALSEYAATAADFDPEMFVPADVAIFSSPYGSWFGATGIQISSGAPDGYFDDQLAFVRPWGFPLERIESPVLLVHGREDRFVPYSHSVWLSEQLPVTELWFTSRDGHVSIFERGAMAVRWLVEHAAA